MKLEEVSLIGAQAVRNSCIQIRTHGGSVAQCCRTGQGTETRRGDAGRSGVQSSLAVRWGPSLKLSDPSWALPAPTYRVRQRTAGKVEEGR